tara:strand:- start:17578 stop:19014 length:1437 start_codon:yes stop_codon:yes gene_type:complete
MIKYDYIIVGSGPTGLSIASILSKFNKKCLILDKETTIGGCHRVQRIDEFFSEHGPRIYLDSFINFKNILSLMDINFNNLFTNYNFNILNISGNSLKILKIKELINLTIEFIWFSINSNRSKQKSVLDISNYYNFSEESKNYLDKLCRLIDGAGSDRFTLYQLFQTFNQNFLYNIKIPRIANDKLLFKLWKKKLLENNVEIKNNININNINILNKSIDYITDTNNNKYYGNNFIFSIPIENYNKIYNLSNQFNSNYYVNKFTKLTKYETYISITFHWNKEIELNKIYGFPKSEWDIYFIVLSDYMDMEFEKSKTLISCCIANTNKKSNFNKKTANECNKQELIDETFRVLKLSFPKLKKADKELLSPNVYKNNKNEWESSDKSYIRVKNIEKFPIKSNKLNNLYSVGTHNLNSNYDSTTIESAVQNSIYFCNNIIPETKNIIELENIWKITNFIYIFIIYIICYIYLIFIIPNYKYND